MSIIAAHGLTMVECTEVDALIRKCLSDLDERFEKNELAYLSLTSKVELPLRDRMAFRLHMALSLRGLMVAREWKAGGGARIDLAILRDGEPLVLMEFKAMYTFDGTLIRKTPTIFPELELMSDLVKLRRVAKQATALYLVLFATHPVQPLSDRCQGVAKYVERVNRAFRTYDTAEQILGTCRNRIEAFLSSNQLHPSMYGVLVAGNCLDAQVEIPFWLVGPLTR